MTWLHQQHPLVWAFLASDFWKGPAGGIIIAVVCLLIKDSFERWRTRQKLLSALKTEAETARVSIEDLLSRFPKIKSADDIVKSVEILDLRFEVLDELPGGWCLFAPSFAFGDLITRLNPKEARAAIEYLDAWARVIEFERRYSSYYTKLVDATPQVKKDEYRTQLRELSIQVRGSLRQLLLAATDLAVARKVVEDITTKGLSWNLWTCFRSVKKLDKAFLEYPKMGPELRRIIAFG